jgi:STE24 endopeptidase
MSDQQPASSDQQPPADSRGEAGMTGGELAEAKRYGRLELVCTLADKALDAAYLAVAAFLLARPIDNWLQTYPLRRGDPSLNMSLRLVAMVLVVTGLHVAVSFPLSCYSGHVLEHRFRLSTQSFGSWLWRYVKRNLVAAALSLVLVLGLYWLIWITGALWWLAAAAAFFVVSIVLGQLAPVLILPLFYRIEKLDAPELTNRLARLAHDAGLSLEGVYRMDLSAETVKGNAMLAGLGRTRRVLLGDTLLAGITGGAGVNVDAASCRVAPPAGEGVSSTSAVETPAPQGGFTPEEIEVVFAHEIGHHVLHHIRNIILSGVLFSAAGFWVCDRLLAAAWSIHSNRPVPYADLPVWTLPLLMLILTLFTMLLEPLQNALSRRFERQADRYALQRTGLRDAYISAFRKLAKLNKDDPSPHWLEVLLFHSHPPVGQRLAMAEQFAGERQQLASPERC